MGKITQLIQLKIAHTAKLSLPPVEPIQYMQRCLELAQLGQGNVAPNPMVGCVIVHDGIIIGEGYHEHYGQAHAEVNAIRSVKNKALLSQSTLYVSLEPCAHHGKTPPCADLILEHRIPEVYIACQDSFEHVAGKSIEKLREAGVKVNVGLLENEALQLNRRFFTFHTKQRPYIILKWAESQDGFVDASRISPTTPPQSISCASANVLSHHWRSQEAAIMVGTSTAMLDNPSLTTRLAAGRNPTRIVIDRYAGLPTTLKLFNGEADTIIINQSKDAEEGRNRWVRVASVDDLHSVLRALWKANVQSILVEGGPTLHASFIRQGLWDEVRKYVSPTLLHSGISSAHLHANPIEIQSIGTDSLYIYTQHRA